MIKVTVDRTKWLRGEGSQASKLFRLGDGKMCCLGFYCVTKGIPIEDLGDIPNPLSVAYPTRQKYSLTEVLDFNVNHKNGTVVLMELNDNEHLSLNARETAIKSVGKEIGIEFEFIN